MQEGKPSETAMRVAVTIVASGLDDVLQPIVRHRGEPYLEWFVRDHSDGARRQLEAWTSGVRAPVMDLLRRRMSEGAGLFTLLRKLYVEDQARAALDAGARQLVVLGAGYDPLALRLCRERPDLRAFEVDHPSTQAVKRRVLAARDAHPPNLTLVPADLATGAAEAALLAAGHDPAQPSFVACEGTIMYLPPAEAEGVIALASRLAAPGSAFVFTWVDARVLADAGTVARALEAMGEPLRSSRNPDAIGPLLAVSGFRLRELGDAATLRGRYLEPHAIARPLSPLEYAVVAERE